MKVGSHKPDFAVQARQSLDWSSKSYSSESVQEFQESTWVHLLELPSPYSFDEALLLCQVSEDQWLAWIPEHGEAVLHISQFCQIS